MKKILLLLLLMTSCFAAPANNMQRHGWPEQAAPKNLIICKKTASIAEDMLAESLSGLAAQAVNEGKFDTMVWMEINNSDYKMILDQSIRALHIQDIKIMDVWSLAAFLKKRGVVKGYVLYDADKQHANAYASNPDTDYSVNTATVYAGLLKGVLVDSKNVTKANQIGLKCLKDARNEDIWDCFRKNKSKLNNHSALSVPPSVHNLRDYAIAHKLMIYDDRKDIIDTILEWVEPMSPILGWGCGDEYDFTSVIAEWGHYNTATNWCYNLPFITSVSGCAKIEKIHEIEPSEINFEEGKAFHSFVMSDGDNIQWSMSSYGSDSKYMGGGPSAEAGMSWTTVGSSLALVSPFTWNTFARYHASSETTFIEYGGGYEYPDLFACKRPNRPEILREFAKRINARNEALGIKVFGFLCRKVDSPAAKEAFQIFAEEMPGLTGMMAVQYFPYELDGHIIWVENKQGIEIPVMTSAYSIWNEFRSDRPSAGVPEFVASIINRDVMIDIQKEKKHFSWTIVHAWSDFAKTSNFNQYGTCGYGPVKATKEMLMPVVETVSLNELLWRVRMEHNPEQTKTFISK